MATTTPPQDTQGRAGHVSVEQTIEEQADAVPHTAEETSFRSLLLELDTMEQGLKTDFDDLLPEESATGQDDEEHPDAGTQQGQAQDQDQDPPAGSAG